MKRKTKTYLLMVFLVIGMFDSVYLLYEHVSHDSSLCNFADAMNCDIVNTSPYSNVDGISFLLTMDLGLNLPIVDISGINGFFDIITSNAFLGLLTLLFVFAMVVSYHKKQDLMWLQFGELKHWIKGILMFSMAYGFYLFLIMHFVLHTYCIFCLFLDLMMLLSLWLSFKLK